MSRPYACPGCLAGPVRLTVQVLGEIATNADGGLDQAAIDVPTSDCFVSLRCDHCELALSGDGDSRLRHAALYRAEDDREVYLGQHEPALELAFIALAQAMLDAAGVPA